MTKKTFIIALILAIIAQCVLTGAISSKLLETIVDGIFTKSDDWDGSSEPFSGEGTKKKPYEIKTAEQLAYLARIINGDFGLDNIDVYNRSNVYYELCADLYMNGYPWTPIGIGSHYDGTPADSTGDDFNEYAFHAKFNGNNHKISGLYLDTADFEREATYVGLFGFVTERIENLTLEGVNVICDRGYYAGALCGRSDATVVDCSAKEVNIEASFRTTTQDNARFFCGGLIGVQSAGMIEGCNTSVNISSSGTVGGLVGLASGTIDKSSSSGNIHYYGEADSIGGLVGELNLWHPFSGFNDIRYNGSVDMSYTSCNIRCMDLMGDIVGDIGGFVGRMESYYVNHCYSTGSIGAANSIYDTSTNGVLANYVGGFFGFANEAGVYGSYTISKIYDNRSPRVGAFGGYMINTNISSSVALGLSYKVEHVSVPFPFDFLDSYYSDTADHSSVLRDCYFAVRNDNYDSIPENKLVFSIPITLDEANSSKFFNDTLGWINDWDYSDLDLHNGIGPSLKNVK